MNYIIFILMKYFILLLNEYNKVHFFNLNINKTKYVIFLNT